MYALWAGKKRHDEQAVKESGSSFEDSNFDGLIYKLLRIQQPEKASMIVHPDVSTLTD